tara:strand:+ start:162 stop:422 length:261 start_codon:yes stop_codon:yes gene_type:complete
MSKADFQPSARPGRERFSRVDVDASPPRYRRGFHGVKIGVFTSVARVAVKNGKRRLANGGVKGWDLQALREVQWVAVLATMLRLQT